jgi:DNA-binding YbaB/EbfC family protein
MNLSMINQAKQLKAKLEETQKELAKLEITADAGKGAVKVTVNGQQEIVAIAISPKVMDPENPEQLERLVLKAVSDAQAKSQKAAGKKMRGLTGGLKVPGLF